MNRVCKLVKKCAAMDMFSLLFLFMEAMKKVRENCKKKPLQKLENHVLYNTRYFSKTDIEQKSVGKFLRGDILMMKRKLH